MLSIHTLILIVRCSDRQLLVGAVVAVAVAAVALRLHHFRLILLWFIGLAGPALLLWLVADAGDFSCEKSVGIYLGRNPEHDGRHVDHAVSTFDGDKVELQSE